MRTVSVVITGLIVLSVLKAIQSSPSSTTDVLSVTGQPTTTISVPRASPTPTLSTQTPSVCALFNGSTTNKCIKDAGSTLYFFPPNATIDTQSIEFVNSVALLKAFLTLASSDACARRILDFTCHYLYPTCDVNASKAVRPNVRDCKCIFLDCGSDWRTITTTVLSDLSSTNEQFRIIIELFKSTLINISNCSNDHLLLYDSTYYIEPTQATTITGMCQSSGLPPTASSQPTEISLSEQILIGATVGSVSLILIALLLSVLCCCCCCYYLNKQSSDEFSLEENQLDQRQPSQLVRNTSTILRMVQRGRKHSKFRSPRELLKQVPSVYLPVMESHADYLIQESRLQTSSFLAEGTFSEVYTGSITDLQPHDMSIKRTVAIKQFREYVGYDDIKKYLENCLKISGAVHPNVLKIVGISFSSLSTVSIVLPYMEENNLLTYLKKLRSSVISSTPPEDFTVKELAHFVSEMSQGMRALSRLNIVYKMLSIQNCLLDYQHKIVVGDISLSFLKNTTQESLQNFGEQNQKSHYRLAPEIFKDGFFTEKSDVWSFGMTSYEVFSFGQPVFSEDSEFVGFMQSEEELPQPLLCPRSLFNIIQSCLKRNPNHRPSFSDLVPVLNTLLHRESFANEIDAINRDLLEGESSFLEAAMPRKLTSVSTKFLTNIPSTPTSPQTIPQVTDIHTSDGYLKVIGDSVREDEYDYIGSVQSEGSPKLVSRDTRTELPLHKSSVSSGSLLSPVISHQIEEEYDYISTSVVSQSPARIIDENEDENGYVAVNKPPPEIEGPYASITYDGNKQLKQSHSQGDLDEQFHHSKDEVFFHFSGSPKGLPKSHFLSLPRSARNKLNVVPKPQMAAKPFL